MIKNLALALVASLRPSSKTSLIALLSLLCLAGFDAQGHSSSDLALIEKDIKKGESIITQLRALEQLPAAANSQNQPKRFEKVSASLFARVATLRASDLKTDLTTAVFLYDEAARVSLDSQGAPPDCERELREVYARLCRESKTGALAGFLMAKARLHIEWAEATIND
jgi:hypothetical protein